MSDDARISTAFPTHPKTLKLIRRMGRDAGWSLVCLLLWTARNKPDGDLTGMSDEDVELAADWAGEPGAFYAALVKLGWLDVDGTDVSIHDWHEHNPWAAASPARKAKARWNAIKKHHGETEANRLVPEHAAVRAASAASSAGRTATSNAGSTHHAESQHPDSCPPAVLQHGHSSAPSQSPSQSPSQEQELPTTSGADAPPVDHIFGRGLKLLTGKGVPELKARAFLGKLRKHYRDDIAVLAALTQCEAEDVSDPIPWLSAAARNARAGPPHPVSKTAAAYFALGESLDRLNQTDTDVVHDEDRPGLALLPAARA